jgi:hypothetical protein
MGEDVPDKPIEDVSGEDPDEALPTPTEDGEAALAETPKVTFRGNSYDLIAMGSLASAALILFTCVTCGMGYYCLPVLSVVLGAIGVLSARQAVEVERTRLWSWLGLAGGGILLLLMAVCFVLYIAFIVIAAVSGGQQWGY